MELLCHTGSAGSSLGSQQQVGVSRNKTCDTVGETKMYFYGDRLEFRGCCGNIYGILETAVCMQDSPLLIMVFSLSDPSLALYTVTEQLNHCVCIT